VARVFLDTNVFLYAHGADSPHRQACLDVLEATSKGDLDGVTSSEVLQEILHVRARRGDVAKAIQMARDAAELVIEALPVTVEDVFAACKILEGHPKMSVRDAIHVAVMQAARIHSLISTDDDFDRVRAIRRIDPKDAI
jgi:predicted nucleic acid-binding protein